MKLLITKLIKTGIETNMYDSTWGSCFKHIVYSGSKVVCFPNIKRLRLRTMAEKPLMKITSVYKFTRYILRLRMETQPSDYMTNNAQHKQEQHTFISMKNDPATHAHSALISNSHICFIFTIWGQDYRSQMY